MRQSVEKICQGKWAREERNLKKTPSQEYVALICRLYGDKYDDREEDSKIRGLDWEPGVKASHKSMAAFQKELEEVHGIHLSRTKLQKILITGNCWTTELFGSRNTHSLSMNAGLFPTRSRAIPFPRSDMKLSHIIRLRIWSFRKP